MYSSYNHTVSTLVGTRLITDSPISRMGQIQAIPYITDIAAAPYGLAARLFPEHVRLPGVLHYGTVPFQTITYGLVQGGSMFGIALPSEAGGPPLYLTVEYDKMAHLAYQEVVARSIATVARHAGVRIEPEALSTVFTLMRLHLQSA